MKLKTEVAKIVGRSKEEIWGQVFQSDSLFLVVEVSVPEDFEAAPLGKEIINALFSKLDQLSTVNLKNLKKLISLQNNSFLDLQISEGIKLNLVLCTLVDSVFYLLILGQGKAFLKRGKKLATLLDGEGSGSGVLKDNDLLILGSPKFNQIISLETLKSNLDQLSPQEIAENLAPLLHSQENSFGAAAMIISSKFEGFDGELSRTVRGSRPEEEKKKKKEEKIPVLWFFSKIKPLIISLRSFLKLPSFVLKRKISQEERAKKSVLTVALILTALLLVSIVFGFGKREKSVREEKFQAIFETASHKFDEGKALLDLNTQKSRELLQEAQESLLQGLEEFKKGSKEKRKIEELLKQIETALKEAEKIYKLADAPLFFDPVFLKDKAFGEKLALYKNDLAILDKKQNTLYYLSLEDKKGKILAGGERVAGSKTIGVHGEKVYVLIKEGIMEVDIRGSGYQDIRIEVDEDWGEIADLIAYRSNVYLLDKKRGILKYLKTDEGLAKRDYLGAGAEFDFSSAVSMAIDGEIWVGKSNEVLRFSLGAPKEFLLRGLEKGLGSRLMIYTDEECENIYILDKEQGRIVILNKEGEYQAQYEWDKIGQAQDIVVSEKERKILVLVEGKIYGLEIK